MLHALSAHAVSQGVLRASERGREHSAKPALISPDNWESDFGFMQRSHAVRMNLDLFYDYRTNVELYPKWQAFLRERQPKTIIFWGQGDIFFTPADGESYLKDLPQAQIHRLNAGHFAVEDHLAKIQRHGSMYPPARAKRLKAAARLLASPEHRLVRMLYDGCFRIPS